MDDVARSSSLQSMKVVSTACNEAEAVSIVTSISGCRLRSLEKIMFHGEVAYNIIDKHFRVIVFICM